MRINASYLLNAHSWTPKIEYKLPLHLDHLRYICSRGGVHSLILPIRVCAAEKGMVFRVLSLKQGIYFHYLASLKGCLFRPEAGDRFMEDRQYDSKICMANQEFVKLRQKEKARGLREKG